MIYRISLNDPKKIVETAIGRQIQAMGFKYNNKHKYWYRKCGHKVMQYLGLARFSGNTYDLCFGNLLSKYYVSEHGHPNGRITLSEFYKSRKRQGD